MPDQICPKCHAKNRAGARFCATCGARLSPTPATCTACGAELRPGTAFCPRCGAPRAEDAATSAAPRPVPPPPPAYRAPPSAPPPQTPHPHPVPTPSPEPPSAEATRATPPPYLIAALASALAVPLTLCLVLGLLMAPAFDASVPTPPPLDPNSPNVTVRVAETYLNDALTRALPQGVPGEAELDVKPDGLLIIHAHFPLLLLDLHVTLNNRISVMGEQIQIRVEGIKTGGEEILDLIGVDEVTLGKDLSTALKRRLETELGEASRILEIRTDEQYITLTAHLALP